MFYNFLWTKHIKLQWKHISNIVFPASCCIHNNDSIVHGVLKTLIQTVCLAFDWRKRCLTKESLFHRNILATEAWRAINLTFIIWAAPTDPMLTPDSILPFFIHNFPSLAFYQTYLKTNALMQRFFSCVPMSLISRDWVKLLTTIQCTLDRKTIGSQLVVLLVRWYEKDSILLLV